MKKSTVFLFLSIGLITVFLYFKPGAELPASPVQPALKLCKPAQAKIDLNACRDNFLVLLKVRNDAAALAEIEKVLAVNSADIEALWGKAEVLRRGYSFAESEKILQQVLSQNPGHTSSLISLSYIRYHDGRFEEALALLKKVLGQRNLSRENKALSYMLIGSINAKKASLGGLFSKVVYGTHIRGYFEKAKHLAPDLSEVYLGLGTFYLLAPRIVGGDTQRAIVELETAVRLTPEFATANVRLAQAYKKKGNMEKYNFYFQQAQRLDPNNEILKELKD